MSYRVYNSFIISCLDCPNYTPYVNAPQDRAFRTDFPIGFCNRVNDYVFTEQGIAMLSAVLNSKIAVNMSIQIMKAFVETRRFLIQNGQVFNRLDRLELKQLEQLKDSGKKWFAFSKLSIDARELLERL